MTSNKNSESATPEHYQKDGQDLLSHLEHIMSEEEMRGSYRFNIMKYATRAGRKDDIVSEIDKIIEYAKRWKEFEESKIEPSISADSGMWSTKNYGDFNPVLQFMSRYYGGEEILSYFDSNMSYGREYKLIINGKPARLDKKKEFLISDDKEVCYSKGQLAAFFNSRRKNAFKGLEILVKKL